MMGRIFRLLCIVLPVLLTVLSDAVSPIVLSGDAYKVNSFLMAVRRCEEKAVDQYRRDVCHQQYGRHFKTAGSRWASIPTAATCQWIPAIADTYLVKVSARELGAVDAYADEETYAVTP